MIQDRESWNHLPPSQRLQLLTMSSSHKVATGSCSYPKANFPLFLEERDPKAYTYFPLFTASPEQRYLK